MEKGRVILFCPGFEGHKRTYHWFPFPYLYLGPFLERAGYKVIIIDARVEPDWKKRLKESLGNALCLGITAMTGPDIKYAIEAVKIAREKEPKLSVIWGGPHVTALPEETAGSDYVDIVVQGHGEHTLVEIVNRIYANKDFQDIPGVSYKKNGNIHTNSKSEIIPFDYDSFPGYHLINVEKYRSPNNVASYFSSSGCPFNCTFCTTGDKGYSLRTLDQVKKELTFLVNDLKFKNIFFQDGTLFVKKERVLAIVRWLLESGLDIKWKAKARANSLHNYSDQELSLLKDSGLISVFFGIESGSKRVLKNMNKKTKPDDAEKSAEICRKYDIEFYTSFMFAVPYETADDLKDTIGHINKLKKINPETIVQNCIYLPLPATEMFEQACKCGFVPPSRLEEWSERDISSRFEERNDVSWIPSNILDEYIKIYVSVQVVKHGDHGGDTEDHGEKPYTTLLFGCSLCLSVPSPCSLCLTTSNNIMVWLRLCCAVFSVFGYLNRKRSPPERLQIYNDVFGEYKHLTEKEQSGEYTSIFKKDTL